MDVRVDDLAVEEAHEPGGGPHRPDEQGGVDGVEVEADGGGAVQRSQEEPAGVGGVRGAGVVAVGRGVGGDGALLGVRGGGVRVHGDRAERDARRESGGVPPGTVGDQGADEGDAGAQDGGGQGRGQRAAVEPVGQDGGGEAQREGGDEQHPQHGVHDDRLPAVVGDGFRALAVEGQQPQPGRVPGGEEGGEQAGDQDGPAGRRGDGGERAGGRRVAGGGVFGGAQDGFLGEEAGERGDGGQGEQRDRHRPVGVGDAPGQAAHP